MAFIRQKRIKGRNYYYLVEGVRKKEGKVQQRVLQYLGSYQDAVKAIKKLKNSNVTNYVERLKEMEGVGQSDCWQTPNTREQPILSLVADVFDGRIGLDPTSDEGKRVDARYHFTKADDCLKQTWGGLGAVFMNPPFSKPLPFVTKLVEEFHLGHTPEAILLLKAGTVGNKGTGPLLAPGAKCFWYGRVWYIDPGTGKPAIGTDFDSVLIYFGANVKNFADVFKPYAASINVPFT